MKVGTNDSKPKKRFNGICADCGKEIGARRVYCDECRRKHRRENERKDYYFYQKMGVCPKCKHRKIEDGKWGCPVCFVFHYLPIHISSSRIYCLINLSAYCGCIIDLAVFLLSAPVFI